MTLLNRSADFLTFGAIKKCKKCGKGDMIFTKHGYTCNHMKSTWVPCANFDKNPRRALCVIPKKLESRFFSTCNLFVMNRAVREYKKIEVNVNAIFGNEKFQSTEPVKRLTLKNGSAVDPEFEKHNETHVYSYKNKVFSCVLNLVDVSTDRNSFFILQVLQSDKDKNVVWLFTKSGRIGTSIKRSMATSFKTAKDACIKFKEIFKLKTGNDWDSKRIFEKRPGKFYAVEIKYESDVKVNITIPTTLANKVLTLMKALFNVKTMKLAMKQYDLDVEKMPLGKLSNNQLKKAHKVLDNLENAIDKNRSPFFICGLTNNFLV